MIARVNLYMANILLAASAQELRTALFNLLINGASVAETMMATRLSGTD